MGAVAMRCLNLDLSVDADNMPCQLTSVNLVSIFLGGTHRLACWATVVAWLPLAAGRSKLWKHVFERDFRIGGCVNTKERT